MRTVWIGSVALAATVAVGAPPAQAQEGITVGGHIGFVLPLVTRVGSRTINDTADQFSIGFPVGVTFKGTGRMALDLEFIPQINTARPRNNTFTIHPGVVWSLGARLGCWNTRGVRRQ